MKKSIGLALLLTASYQTYANVPVSQCRGNNLTIALAKTDAAMSKYVYYYNVKNRSSRPCFLNGDPQLEAVNQQGKAVRLPLTTTSYFNNQLTRYKSLLLAPNQQIWFSVTGSNSRANQNLAQVELYQKIQFTLAPSTTVLTDLHDIAVTDNLTVTPYQKGPNPQ